jgi:hypothetical protein
MSLRQTVRTIAGLIVVAAVGIASPAHATGPETLFVNPGGAGAVCNHTDPCAIDEAMNDANTGDTIIIEPGSYGTSHAPLGGQLALSSPGVTVHSQAGSPMPVITSDATVGLVLTAASSLDGVALKFSGTKAALDVPATATASHLIVRTSTGNAACVVNGTLSDSLCVTSETGASAVVIQVLTGTITTTLRNVTAESTNATGIGVNVEAGDETPGDGATLTVHATNVIAHGGLTDLQASAADDATTTAKVSINHSDFGTATATAGQGTATIIGSASNIQAPPRFVNAAKGDYREALSSPTVNAGAAAPKADTDLAGNSRTLGSAPDIGAYELPQAPRLSALTASKVSRTSAHLSVAVNAEGLATSLRATATHGHSHVLSATVSGGSGRTSRAVHLTFHGLLAHTTYIVVVTGRNTAGASHSRPLTFTTT